MSSRVKIADICTRICSGGTPKSGVVEFYENGKIPWLNTGEINFNRIRHTNSYITEAGLASSSAKWISKNSISIAMYGATAGKAAVVKIPLTTNQACCNLEVNESVADYRFVYYWLQSNYSKLANLANGGAQQNLSAKTIKALEIDLPPMPIQRSVAEVLSQLDDKLELNNRLNDYLATLVDLEFSKQFSGSVSTTSLKNVLEISTKSLKPQQHAGETWEHYSIPAFDEMHWPIFELADGIKSNKYIVDRSSILISKLNPSIKRMWIPACLTDKAVCSTEFIVYKPLEPRHKSFYCAAINAASFTAFLLEHVTGSTGSRQRAQPKATLDYPMPSPCRTAIEAFCDFADPIYRQIELNGIESQRLGSLRDALLPKLMSGEIDVSKVGLMQPNNHLSAG